MSKANTLTIDTTILPDRSEIFEPEQPLNIEDDLGKMTCLTCFVALWYYLTLLFPC